MKPLADQWEWAGSCGRLEVGYLVVELAGLGRARSRVRGGLARSRAAHVAELGGAIAGQVQQRCACVSARLEAGVVQLRGVVCFGVASGSMGSMHTMLSHRCKETENLRWKWARSLTSQHIPFKTWAAYQRNTVLARIVWGSEFWAHSPRARHRQGCGGPLALAYDVRAARGRGMVD